MSDFGSITITLAPPQVGTGDPASGTEAWIRLVQVGFERDTATPAETAELVDETYQVESCIESAEEQQQNEPVPLEDFQEIVKDVFDPAICDSLGDDFVTQIKVIRSDNSKPYTLRLSAGEVLTTETVSETRRDLLVVNDSNSTSLAYSPAGDVSLAWAINPDDPVTPNRAGSTIHFDQQITGTLEAEYQTVYDLVTVKVPEDAMAIAFYSGLVEELDLQKPDIEGVTDEDISMYCSDPVEQWGVDLEEGEHICHEIVRYEQLDDCTGSRVDVDTQDQVIDCWKDFGKCYHENGCYHLKGTRTVTAGFVDTGYEDQVSDPEFYKDKCCEDWPFSFPMPRCTNVYSQNVGGKTLSAEDVALYRGLYGDNTVFIPVSPSDGDCGTTVTKQRVLARNCCDGVQDLVWDESVSPETCVANSSFIVGVTGGRRPLEFELHGNGFWTDANHTQKTCVTNSRIIAVYADSQACGPLTVDVSDGCSSTVGYIRETTRGHWEIYYTWYKGGVPYCRYPDQFGAIYHKGLKRFSAYAKVENSIMNPYPCDSPCHAPTLEEYYAIHGQDLPDLSEMSDVQIVQSKSGECHNWHYANYVLSSWQFQLVAPPNDEFVHCSRNWSYTFGVHCGGLYHAECRPYSMAACMERTELMRFVGITKSKWVCS